MPRDRHIPWRWVIALAVLAGLTALVATLVLGGRSVPDGPEPVAWNRQACAHCRMLVGDPAFAAQLITTEGDVEYFDDPGCLMRYLDDRAPRIHRMWFHAHDGDRWLGADEVGFVPSPTATPMGYGLAAVPRATPGALELAAARRALAAPAAHAPVANGAAP